MNQALMCFIVNLFLFLLLSEKEGELGENKFFKIIFCYSIFVAHSYAWHGVSAAKHIRTT